MWLERFEVWMESRGIAGPTHDTYRSAMSGMYRLALMPAFRKAIGIAVNPSRGIPRDRAGSRVVTLLLEQTRDWIDASSDHVRLAIPIATLTAKPRLKDILRLRWDEHITSWPRGKTVRGYVRST